MVRTLIADIAELAALGSFAATILVWANAFPA
jgi:hypothetical protein